MAHHARDLIREAVRLLLANIPGLEDHVIVDQAKIVTEAAAPWCYVWLADEDIENRTIGQNPKKQRSTLLHLDLIGRDQFAVEQQCEDIGALIEARFDAAPTLGGLVKSASLRGITLEHALDAPILRYRMTYVVNYWTEAGTATATV